MTFAVNMHTHILTLLHSVRTPNNFLNLAIYTPRIVFVFFSDLSLLECRKVCDVSQRISKPILAMGIKCEI